MTAYAKGFRTLPEERHVESLPVRGRIPDWLDGTLIRNGPACFEDTRPALRHWFDGLAMVHAFTFSGSRVSYRNKYLESSARRSVAATGVLRHSQFATDPCGSYFGRVFSFFLRRAEVPNANVNVALIGGRTLALTEVPLAVQFDPTTLRTVGVTPLGDRETRHATAHPHVDPETGDAITFALKFGKNSEYRVYRHGTHSSSPELVCAIPWQLPGYVHSFAITARHVVLVVFPFVVDPLTLLLRRKPFIENYRWRPDLGTGIVVVETKTGRVVGRHTTEPFFCFHHVNAWEEGDDIVFDLCAYDDASVIDSLYLDRLTTTGGVPLAHPRRYRVRDGRISFRQLGSASLELPRINHAATHTRPHSYCYGVGSRAEDGRDFLDQLVKLDTRTGVATTWYEPGRYPGEPVFVAAPEGSAEDAGVLLSVVLDPGQNRSFLLVLDAASLREIGRVVVPHAIPFGFHGLYTT